MAKYDVTFNCGHEGRVDIIGKVKDRERKIEWYENHALCPDCYEAEKQRKFDEENQKAAAEAAEYGLPELTGTEKQVAWANTLRQEWIKVAEKHISLYERNLNSEKATDEQKRKLQTVMNGMKNTLENLLLTETSARYWIDSRGGVIVFLEDAARKALITPPETVEVPKAIQQEAIEEMTIRPSEPITDLVTEIRIKDTVISVKLPEKDEDFRRIVKSLRLEWKEGRWQRDINNETKGTPIDRAAELGIKLLAAGFPIRVYRDDLHQRIISGTFDPECDRWILMYEKGFRIWWHREEGDFYNEAKRLPGARWIRDMRSMYIPSEAFRDLQGFAERYEFRFTVKAQERLAEAARDYEKAMVLDVSAPQKERLPEPGSVPEKLEVKEFDIDEGLRDEN